MHTSPTKALAATTPSAVVMWLKYAMGLNKAADFSLSTSLPSEKDAKAIKVPCQTAFTSLNVDIHQDHTILTFPSQNYWIW